MLSCSATYEKSLWHMGLVHRFGEVQVKLQPALHLFFVAI